MHPEALILRRCYPVPVTFADLRAARSYQFPQHRPTLASVASGDGVVGE